MRHEATSWAEAMRRRYHEWRGWGPYTPFAGDPGPYTAQEERAASGY